jgi:hypothetical protein
MRICLLSVFVLASLVFIGCNSTVDRTERQPASDADTASQKAGKVAHDIVKETDEAARKAGREIKKAATGMKEGWKEAEREDPIKKKH